MERSSPISNNKAMVLDDLKNERDKIISLVAKYDGHNVRVFGSLARGETETNSDIDLLIEFEPKHSLLDQADLIRDLEEALDSHVDVVEPQALHWFIKDRVLEEAVPL